MIVPFTPVKWIHVTCALASGGLFACRGLLVGTGHARLAQHRGVRVLSYAIDSVLLVAGLVLVAILPHGMFANGWLATKLGLLVIYIVLGSLALKRARTPGGRRASFIAALLVYVAILGVARMHHPLGWFYGWLR